MAPAVSIIVVTWNALDHVDDCLAAIYGDGGAGVDFEVLVVDNASTDGTPAHVRERWPAARVIEAGRNGGMAAGNNVGMLAATGDSFLLLNSDAFLQPGSLRTLVRRLAESGDRVAAVAPLLRNTDGTLQRSVRGFPTPWRYATEFWYLRRLAPRSRALNAFYGGGVDLAQPGLVDWATGACLLVPRAAVDAVGLMDEAYFMYGEEVDWLRRMARVGRRVAWEPRAEVVHVGGGSARREWGRMYQVQLANHVRYMARVEGAVAARRARRVIVGGLRMRALAWRLLALRPGAARAERAARADAFRAGAATVAAIDVEHPTPAQVPAWPAATHGEPDPIVR
jgi:GT2 family glycosyltransferase